VIQVLEHDRDDLDDPPQPPDYFDGDVLVCDSFRGLVGCLDEATILLMATDDVGVETAVRIAVYKSRLARNIGPSWDDIPAFRIGHEFLASFHDIDPTHKLSGNVLEAIVQTLEGLNLDGTHWLRTGKGGDNPQRLRKSDGAGAWRRDIDSEHHLHYWVCREDLVELASVSFPHDDFTIPE
jgi:hypothetical protein